MRARPVRCTCRRLYIGLLYINHYAIITLTFDCIADAELRAVRRGGRSARPSVPDRRRERARRTRGVVRGVWAVGRDRRAGDMRLHAHSSLCSFAASVFGLGPCTGVPPTCCDCFVCIFARLRHARQRSRVAVAITGCKCGFGLKVRNAPHDLRKFRVR